MHPLETMFRPRSVAVIGASGDPEKLGGRTLFHIKELGYGGRIFPINVSGKDVQGLPSWNSVADLPEVPDSALIVLPAALVPQALEDCAAKGILQVQVLSSGFAEEGGEGIALQARVVEPLMGYTSSADMHSQIRLCFETKDEAIAYAERYGIPFQVLEPHEAPRKKVAYSDNFAFRRVGQWTH